MPHAQHNPTPPVLPVETTGDQVDYFTHAQRHVMLTSLVLVTRDSKFM
jgi:hypothetical protein